MITLLTLLWNFSTAQPAHSTLTTQSPQAEFAAPAEPARGFTVGFSADLKAPAADRTILEIPGVLEVRLRQHNPQDRQRQNYPAYKMADGSVPVLEARLALHSPEHPDWKTMTIGVPLAMLKPAAGEHKVVLNFTGVRWTMYVDGELLDNDFPFGYPPWAATNTWKMDPVHVKQAVLYLSAIAPRPIRLSMPNRAEVQYWMPQGHNAWVGDVATLYYQGRYHVFYLYDRRHHASKFGQGAHYFEHLSTADFKTWTEHEAATPLEEQWECIGTGTPFVFDGKLCLAYGLHTERIYPNEKTTLPAQQAYLKANGRTGTFDRRTPGAPIGATYAISADGIANFQKTGKVYHPCRNPSIYRNPDGKLRMLANHNGKGMWESESVDGGWRCLNPDFPPGGDCTFFFRWGRFDYIIGGFTSLWSKRADAPEFAYEDVVRQGRDFYDGLAVPAISEIPGGRFLMAGWVGVRGWGGPLVIRELIQHPDGRIGSKWMEEIVPATAPQLPVAVDKSGMPFIERSPRSFLLTFDVVPAEREKGRLAVAFLPATGSGPSCEFQVRLEDQRAQFAPVSTNGFAAPQKSLREGGQAHTAIEQIIGVDRPFTVRLIVKGNDKLGGSLIDSEIAGQRTMISYRPDLKVETLRFRTEGVALRNVRFAALEYW